MNDVVSCIDNLSRMRYIDFRLDFEDSIHCFAHNFNVALYEFTKDIVILEYVIPSSEAQ